MTVKIIFQKLSDDGRWQYRLVNLGNKYIAYKSKYRKEETKIESEFSEKLREFSDEEKAKKFIEKLQ